MIYILLTIISMAILVPIIAAKLSGKKTEVKQLITAKVYPKDIIAKE